MTPPFGPRSPIAQFSPVSRHKGTALTGVAWRTIKPTHSTAIAVIPRKTLRGLFTLWARRDSNPGPPPCQGGALTN